MWNNYSKPLRRKVSLRVQAGVNCIAFLSGNTIVSLYIYHFSTVMTSHLKSTVVLLDTGTPGTSREIYSEDADDGTRTRNPSVINRVL